MYSVAVTGECSKPNKLLLKDLCGDVWLEHDHTDTLKCESRTSVFVVVCY